MTSRVAAVRRTLRPRDGSSERGQSLVEFTLVLIPFLFLLFGMVDLARGVYTYNAVSEAAREMARAMSSQDVCCDTGSSAEAIAVREGQKNVVPGLTDEGISISCVDALNASVSPCEAGDYVRVTVTVQFSPVTPLVGLVGPVPITATSRIQYT